MKRVLPWALLAVVLAAALVVGTRTDEGPRTEAERVEALADSLRCQTCRGQSVADSDAPSAAIIRDVIAQRVADGQSDDEIRAAMVASYGEQILLNPSRSGLASLVWVLPVAALVVAVGGLVLAFLRRPGWRTALAGVGIAAVAVTAGLAVSASAGSRLPGDTITGDIRETTAAQLQEAAVLASQQQYREALDLYDEVLAEDPENVEALSERGLLLVTLSQAAELPNLAGEGRRSVEEALRLDPDNPRSLFYLGLALRLEGDDTASRDAIERALAADPPPLLREQIEGFLSTAGAGS